MWSVEIVNLVIFKNEKFDNVLSFVTSMVGILVDGGASHQFFPFTKVAQNSSSDSKIKFELLLPSGIEIACRKSKTRN